MGVQWPTGGLRKARVRSCALVWRSGRMCRSHKVSCRDMTEGDEWGKSCIVSLYIPRGVRCAHVDHPQSKHQHQHQQWPPRNSQTSLLTMVMFISGRKKSVGLLYRVVGSLLDYHQQERRGSVMDPGTVLAMGPQAGTRPRAPRQPHKAAACGRDSGWAGPRLSR